ncbi:tetratricopeptide repeat protein [Vibrio sp. B1FLJ16]|uniref:tetratricopeptide repeat protein n=1 Tax=Vibrio sp. B1FLJ16 TaxID=2751178 RepID=UPI0015F71B9A
MESTLSAINKALSEISEKTSPSELTRADIPQVSRSKPWVWLVAGFSLSLAVGGWAVSRGPVPAGEIAQYQPSVIRQAEDTANDTAAYLPTSDSPTSSSPTSKVTPEINHPVYSKPFGRQSVAEVTEAHSLETVGLKTVASETVSLKTVSSKASAPLVDDFQPRKQPQVVTETPVLVAQVATASSTKLRPVSESSMSIEHVELTHRQLAAKALGRAEKAMDANDMQTALSAYSEALRYEPMNADTRQKLAALYFGKGDTRKAYEIVQEGINLDTDSQVLRLALSKLLVKANQPEAALSPLVHLPPLPGKDYLAMRAALAQKQKQNEIALESYQLLTQRDPENARWWLGLGIQQERALQFMAAISSYQKALGKVGISNQSQAFIRDRLTILKQLENAQ